jgi:hypothetical protein
MEGTKIKFICRSQTELNFLGWFNSYFHFDLILFLVRFALFRDSGKQLQARLAFDQTED